LLLKLFLLFAASAGSLPWTENNYQQALAAAKSRQVPLFVEVWAPW
jgi:thioredoxin-like negative regulator of GroEL